jgi:hypothetical protein
MNLRSDIDGMRDQAAELPGIRTQVEEHATPVDRDQGPARDDPWSAPAGRHKRPVVARSIFQSLEPGSVVSIFGFVRKVVVDVALGLKLRVQFRLID